VEEQVVRLDKRIDHVAIVTIDRPEARNAIDGAVARQLEAAVLVIEADPDLWVAVLTGAGGKAFSAGADLKEVARGKVGDLYTEAGGFGGFVQIGRTKPWIAAVDGMALGGGLELALACDMIVASQGSAFGLPEVTRGLLAAAGGAYRLARALPRALAVELLLTGNRLSADQAAAFGLVNRLAPAGQALDEALTLAAAIAANAPLAVRESLAIARASVDLDETALRHMSDQSQKQLQATKDFAEGARAFVEKRPPVWQAR
jgi:enoyl-CoA hydratase/carnithine racemase